MKGDESFERRTNNGSIYDGIKSGVERPEKEVLRKGPGDIHEGNVKHNMDGRVSCTV